LSAAGDESECERTGDAFDESTEEIELRSAMSIVSSLLLSMPLFGGMVAAQDGSRPDGPVAVIRTAEEPTANLTEPAAPSASIKSQRVIDKKFLFVMGALGGAESMRFTTRKLVIEREYAAGAPWITSVPANRPMIAKDLGLFASELFVAYEMKKSHDWLPGDRVIRKLWWVYPAAMSVIHVKNGVGNIRTQGPGGCTSIECAMQMQ
jgi:hypothetical protein